MLEFVPYLARGRNETKWPFQTFYETIDHGILDMIAYEFYRRDERGKDHFIWILPERRKNPERITQESIINWGRKAVVDNTEVKDIFFIRVELDETGIEFQGLIPLSELRKKLRKEMVKIRKQSE